MSTRLVAVVLAVAPSATLRALAPPEVLPRRLRRRIVRMQASQSARQRQGSEGREQTATGAVRGEGTSQGVKAS